MFAVLHPVMVFNLYGLWDGLDNYPIETPENDS